MYKMYKLFQMLLVVVAVSLSGTCEAGKWIVDYVHDKTNCHYCALCFTKKEVDDFKVKLNTAAKAAEKIAGVVSFFCPEVAPVSEAVGKIIAGSNTIIQAVINWNTSKGTGLSINIPSQMIFRDKYQNERGFMGVPLTPFVWESSEG